MKKLKEIVITNRGNKKCCVIDCNKKPKAKIALGMTYCKEHLDMLINNQNIFWKFKEIDKLEEKDGRN
jgi:hypothetical protein